MLAYRGRLILAVIALLLAATVPALADSAETIHAATLTKLLASAGGEAIGDLSPATPLTVKSHKDGFAEVEVSGWSPAGGDRYLFKDVGLRIPRLVLTEDGLKARTGGESKEDDYESEWQQATVTGWVAEKDTVATLDPVWAAAGDLYFSRCTRCHSLRRPGDFTANQWPQALKVMTVRAGMTPAQAALVTVLLQTHGKDQHVEDSFTKEVASKPVVAAPAASAAVAVAAPEQVAKGGDLFKSANCFACHGEDARTPVMPEFPKLAAQNAAYLLKQLQDFKSGTRSNDANSAMRDTLKTLSDADLQALAAWLSTR